MSDDNGDHERRDGTESEDRRRFLKLAGVTGTAGAAGIVGSNGVLSALAAEGDGDDEGVEIEDLQGQMPIENRDLRIAVLAAAKAAQLHQNYFGEIGEAEEKDPQNLLTEVDTEAETLIRDTIKEELGDDFEDENHALYGEEQGGQLEVRHRVRQTRVSPAQRLRTRDADRYCCRRMTFFVR